MMRLVAFVAALAMLGAPVWADRFLGRTVEITDGRRDTNSAAPLVVVMHGFLGSGRNMRKKTRFDAVARQQGFVVAYPNGRARRWNDGRSPDNKVDDVAYLTALIRALVADGRADAGRVFLAGHSNGGGMAMRMACDRPDLIAGISVVATKSALNYQCGNGRPVPAVFIHGTLDPIAPHGGRAADSRLGGGLSSDATLALWKKRNRCGGRRMSQTIDRVEDGTSAEMSRYSGCAAALVSVVIDGHGHDWPSPWGRKTRLQGPATKEINATALTWRFFSGL